MEEVNKDIIPLGDMVLFEHILPSKEDDLIVMPDTVKRSGSFTVLDIGENVKKVSVGDSILFINGKPISITHPGIKENIFMVNEEHIIAIIKETN